MIIMMISASRRKKGKGKVKPNRTFKKRPKLEEENEERKKGEKKERFGNPDKKKKELRNKERALNLSTRTLGYVDSSKDNCITLKDVESTRSA